MTPITFKKNSWHRWFLLHFGSLEQEIENIDLCTYIKMFPRAIFHLLTAIVAVFVMVGVPLRGLYWLITVHHGKTPDVVGMGIVFLAIYVLAAIGIVTYNLVSSWRESRAKRAVNKQPSFIKTAYRTFKDKVCVKITFQ